MRLVAGVDVGNTTTEVVVVEAGAETTGPLAWDRAPTRGHKGSTEAWLGAAGLVRRLERRIGGSVQLVAVAPQHPVDTRAASLPQASPPLGRLELVPSSGGTPGGTGLAVGAPMWADDPPRRTGTGVVLLVRPGSGFRVAVDAYRAWIRAGADVRGMLLADDEGVLVAARLERPVPVLDQADVGRAATARLLALEVREPGHPLQSLVDPIRLSDLLGLGPDEVADAVALAAVLGDASKGVVGLRETRSATGGSPAGELLLRGHDEPMSFDLDVVSALPVGAVRRYTPPGSSSESAWQVDDLWAVGMREVAASVVARTDDRTARAFVVAALRARPDSTASAQVLGDELGVAVRLFRAEAEAARVGALTTPGAAQAAVVVDLGGGTIDVLGPGGREVVAAGGGEMLTAAVSAYLRLPRGAADWVKRGPAARLEAPQVLLAEDGVRTFLERPAAAAAVGSLVVSGPAGLLPFSGTLAPAEWRALRLRLKQRVLMDNLARALRDLDEPVRQVLLVGGVAGDEELLGLARQVLPGIPVGIGHVAGSLGPRYGVAYGLALLALGSAGA